MSILTTSTNVFKNEKGDEASIITLRDYDDEPNYIILAPSAYEQNNRVYKKFGSAA